MAPAELLRLLLDPDRLAVAGVGVAPDADQGGRRRHRPQRAGGPRRDRRPAGGGPGHRRRLALHDRHGRTSRRRARGGRARRADGSDHRLRHDRGRAGDPAPLLRGAHADRDPRQPRQAPGVLLQRLALEFDVGRYTEREVNDILFAFHPDWSTLRRYLVDEGFLDREHVDDQNWYWRAGGRVTDLPANCPTRVASPPCAHGTRSDPSSGSASSRPTSWRGACATRLTVEDMRRIAKRRLPQGVFDYIDGGAEDERSWLEQRSRVRSHRVLSQRAARRERDRRLDHAARQADLDAARPGAHRVHAAHPFAGRASRWRERERAGIPTRCRR